MLENDKGATHDYQSRDSPLCRSYLATRRTDFVYTKYDSNCFVYI